MFGAVYPASGPPAGLSTGVTTQGTGAFGVATSATLTAPVSFSVAATVSVGSIADFTVTVITKIQLSTSGTLSITPILAATPSFGISTASVVNNPVAVLLGNSTFGISSAAPLTTGAVPFTASAEVDFGITFANLRAASPLATSAAIDFSPNASLLTAAAMSVAATLSLSVTPILTMEAPLSTDTVFFGMAVTTALSVGGVPLSAAPAISISTQNIITSVPAVLNATPTVAISTAGTITPSGLSVTNALITFNGVVASNVRAGSISVTDSINETSNTCEFIVDGTAPGIGTDVKIGLQNLLPTNLLFAGTVTRRVQRYESKPGNPAWDISCRDYTFLINRRLVWGTFTNVSATTIAVQIINTKASGFSTSGIVGSLPAVTVSFSGVPVMEAMTELATLIGGYTDVDYSKIVYLYVTNTRTNPDPLDGSNATVLVGPPISNTLDEGPLRTRVYVTGKSVSIEGTASVLGVTTPTVITNDAVIPVTDSSIFSFGQIISEDQQIINYTGSFAGGVTTKVNASTSLNAPTFPGLPTVAVGVSGGLSGVYQYVVAFGKYTTNPDNTGALTSGSQETPVSLPSLSVNCPEVSAPSQFPGLGSTGAVGPLIGLYKYKITFITKQGETLPGSSVVRLASAFGPPSSAPFVTNGAPIGNLSIGSSYQYGTTFVTKYGETRLSPATGSYIPASVSPAGMDSVSPTAFGGLVGGGYFYGITVVTSKGESSPPNQLFIPGPLATAPPSQPFWTGFFDTNGRIAPIPAGQEYFWACSAYSDIYGETPLSPAVHFSVGGSFSIRVQIQLPPLPFGADGLRVYRAITNQTFLLNADFRRGSVPASYFDVIAQSEMGSQFPTQTLRAGTGIQLRATSSAEPGVVARRIYRTKAGGSDFFLVAEIQNNQFTTITDNLPDSQLTTRSPAVQTLGRQAQVTAIPTSGTVGVTGRNLYRTKAGGSTFYLVAALRDNITTTYLDDVADSALTVAAPGISTAGGDEHVLTSIQTGVPGILGRNIYRTTANTDDYHLAEQLRDNTATSWIDSVADSSLGASIPLVNTAGASAVLLSSLPIGPSGVNTRVIYRNKIGSVGYFYAGTVTNNTDSSYLDTKSDDQLGRSSGDSSILLLGALPGDTSIVLASTTGFPSEGWILADSQYIHYHGLNNAGGANRSLLINIPVTGQGSITAAIATGSTIKALPLITGTSGILNPLSAGTSVALFVQNDSVAGQTAIAASEGGDGIHEFSVTDGSLESVAACVSRGLAELTLFQFVSVKIVYKTLDTKSRSGTVISVALPAPLNITESLTIQQVRITDIDLYGRTPPVYEVTAINAKFSLQDLIRHIKLT